MHRIEFNVQTGELQTIELSPAEVQDVQNRAAAEQLKPKIKTLEERIETLEALLERLK